MAGLVIGTDKTATIPVLEKEASPVINSLNVTPSTSAQTITAPSGVDGYSPVNVAAVNASIDANIIPGNIKSGVSILGVNGSVIALNGQSRNVQLTSQGQQTFTPFSPYNALTSISVSPNNYYLQTITPTTSAQTYTIPSGYSGNGTVRINPVTYTIDNNIVPGNIKSGVSILGVTGNYTGTTPSGTTYITTNGTHNVSGYATADVQVPTTATLTTKNITANGTYNASSDSADGYSQVTVSVPSPIYYVEKTLDANNKLVGGSSIINFSGIEDVGNYALYYAYYNNTSISGMINFQSLKYITGMNAFRETFRQCTGITSVSASNLETISGNSACQYMFSGCTNLQTLSFVKLSEISGSNACSYMFQGCNSIASAPFPNLEIISGNYACQAMFYNCPNITMANLSKLITISGSNACYNMFYNCTGLTNVMFDELYEITNTSACQVMFNGCTGLTSISFPSLEYITGSYACRYMFQNCSGLVEIRFPALTTSSFGTYANQFTGMLTGCSNVVLYFPSNMQSTIQSLAGYPYFGGTNTTNSFTLPPTA